MFQPVIPGAGLSGWRFLQQTYDSQRTAFNQSVQLQRETIYFRDNIAKVDNAEALVSDRQLLTVALGAFGLQDDIGNTFFLKKMLSEGTTAQDALANRFSDNRYKEFAAAFGFGPNEARLTGTPGFADKIIEQFEASRFEIAAGNQDETMRIALFAERKLPELAGGDSTEAAKWFSIMGEAPMRKVFETVFGLPTAFGQLDIDQQLGIFQDRADRMFGSSDPAQFDTPETLNDLITKYVAVAQLSNVSASNSSAGIALQLLGGNVG